MRTPHRERSARRKRKGRDRSRPFMLDDVMREAYFTSARLGGVAGHDLISVS